MFCSWSPAPTRIPSARRTRCATTTRSPSLTPWVQPTAERPWLATANTTCGCPSPTATLTRSATITRPHARTAAPLPANSMSRRTSTTLSRWEPRPARQTDCAAPVEGLELAAGSPEHRFVESAFSRPPGKAGLQLELGHYRETRLHRHLSPVEVRQADGHDRAPDCGLCHPGRVPANRHGARGFGRGQRRRRLQFLAQRAGPAGRADGRYAGHGRQAHRECGERLRLGRAGGALRHPEAATRHG